MLSTGEELDPRVRRTRQLIVDAFLDLLREKTLHATTVGDIAKRAGINRSTFYSHFFDKYALFNHVVRQTLLQTLHDHLPQEAAYSAENVQALVLAVCHFFVSLNNQCPPSDRQLRPVAETQVQAVVYEMLGGWLQGRSDVQDAELTANYLSWAIFGAALEWLGNGSGQGVEETATTIFRLVDKTLCVPVKA